jgi:autotransporter-associated beta strand protein
MSVPPRHRLFKWPRRLPGWGRILVIACIAASVAQPVRADDGTWVGGTDWADPANWSSNPVVPDGTATFTNTGTATVDSSAFVVIGGIQFTAAPNAQAYTINNNADIFAINGAGVFNNSTNPQTFNVLGDNFILLNSATASGGSGTVNIVNSTSLTFQDFSTAGNANITNNSTGILNWFSSATAAMATLSNSGSATFNDTSTAGTATITNNASGTLTFSNTSSAQGATIVNDGSVLFGNSSQAGTATITNNATMGFSDSANAGAAGITNSATGALTFSGSSSAQGATILNDGSVLFSNAAKAGTANVTNNNTLDFTDAASADHAAITNNSAITFAGTSTADHAAITYGATFASTSFFDSSTAGNATFQSGAGIAGNYTSFFNSSSAGSASILNTSGFVMFSSAATAESASITNTGSLILGQALTKFDQTSTAGNAAITNNFGGTTQFEAQSTAGTAAIVNNPSGATIFGLSGGSTASADHATILNAAGPGAVGTGGITEFLSSTTAGNATITTQSAAGVAFFETSSGGAARFITEASGVFDMSQLTSAGMTAGSIEGAGTYYLGNKQLTVGGNNLSTTVSGVISDGSCGCFGAGGVGGSLVKVGTGTLTLAGINTYTGATDVNGGTLSVNGSTAPSSLTTVNAGGTLGGTGTVGNTIINGGTLAPGNSIGTLTVQGSLVFTAASSYMIEVSPTNADRTNVTGTATLGGAAVSASFAAGSYVTRQYTILSATGGLGGTTFNAQVNGNLPAGFKSSLSYDANNAYLDIEVALAQYSGLNANQQNVANALTNSFNTTGGIPLVFGTLTPAGLTQVSGELATGSQQATFDAMNLFLGLLTDPFVAGRGEPAAPASGPMSYAGDADTLAYAARSAKERDAYAAIYRKAPPMVAPTFAQRWSVWAAGFGGSQTTDGNAALGSNTATSRIYGGAVGADYRISPDTLAGFAMAGGGTHFSVANAGSGRSDLFQAGAYLRHTAGPAYLSAAVAYGWQDVTTDRTVTVAGVDRLRAQFNANAWSGRIEAGYRLANPWLAVTPYAAGQVTAYDLPAYAESMAGGVNTFALAYAAKTVSATRSELGLRSDKSWALGDGLFTLRGRAAWAHDYNTDCNVQATFQTLPGASFVVNGASPARDAALTTASAEWKFSSGISLAATLEGEFSDVTRSYAGKGVARYAW